MKMSPHLSLDIQVEIIKRLPVKSLIQFRSVCEAWRSSIDSSDFVTGYNVPHDQPQHLMMSYEVGQEKEVKHVCFVDDHTFPQQKFALTVPPLAQGTKLIGSSHGLFCFTDYFRDPDDSSIKRMAIVWNPTIRKSIAIVLPGRVKPSFHHVIGFGVCPETKDPTLVNITYIDSFENPCEVMVFTLRSGEWRCLHTNQLPRKSIEIEDRFQTVIGQFIYWRAHKRITFNGQFRKHNLIMSFDLSTDEFREVHLPDTLWRKSDLTISKLRESLVVLDYNINSTTNKEVCDVWMMEHGDPKVFTKLFTIKVLDVFWVEGFRNNGEVIIGVTSDDEDMFSQCALVVYDKSSEHIKDLAIPRPMGSFNCSIYTYTESLLLLNHDDGRIVKCGAVN